MTDNLQNAALLGKTRYSIQTQRTRDRDAIRAIFRAVAHCHGCNEADIYVRDKAAEMAQMRWAAWASCRLAGFSLPAIAAVGGWDHTSVMHGIKRHNEAVRA